MRLPSVNLTSNYLTNIFTENAFSSLNRRQKIIGAIACVAFACIAAMFYAFYRYCYKSLLPLNGYGKKVHSNGRIEEGEFKNDQLNGQGKITRSDGGWCLEGQFKNGSLNGLGKKICSNGTIFEGNFEDDYLHGKGKMINLDGHLEEGRFECDVLNGVGSVIHSDGEKWVGNFVFGNPTGVWQMIKTDGTVLFLDEGKKANGDGYLTKTIFGPNCKIDGQKIEAAGQIDEGSFVKGYLHGHGKRTLPGGIEKIGTFDMGVFMGPVV